MKHLKLYEEFNHYDIDPYGEEDWTEEASLYVKSYDSPRLPEKPYRRKLSEPEIEAMFRLFPTHSWCTSIDKNGHIVLGGGECPLGKYYITEEDLKKLS